MEDHQKVSAEVSSLVLNRLRQWSQTRQIELRSKNLLVINLDQHLLGNLRGEVNHISCLSTSSEYSISDDASNVTVLKGMDMLTMFDVEYGGTFRSCYQIEFPSVPIVWDNVAQYDSLALNWIEKMMRKGCPLVFCIVPEVIQQSLNIELLRSFANQWSFERISEHPNLQVLVVSDFRHPLGIATLPSVQSRQQFRFLLQSRTGDLKSRLNHVLRMVKFRMLPDIHSRVVSCILRDVSSGRNDEEIYDHLFSLVHRELLRDPSVIARLDAEKQSRRAESRVDDLVSLVRTFVKVDESTKFLDFGCSEGSITAALASALSIQPSQAFGCDVFAVKSHEGFQFCMTDGIHLPYPDAQFPFATALMSLHHVVHFEEAFAELTRVVQPGGILIIREHDCQPPELAVLLDVMHGMYASVWADPRETEDFCSSYWAHYRSREEFRKLICARGYTLEPRNDERPLPRPVFSDSSLRGYSWSECQRFRSLVDRHERSPENPFRHYYDVFRKAL